MNALCNQPTLARHTPTCLTVCLVAALAAIATSPAYAAVMGVDSITVSPGGTVPYDKNQSLTSITVGSTTFTTLISPASADSNNDGKAFKAKNGTGESDAGDAVSDGDITTKYSNYGSPNDIDFGQSIGDRTIFWFSFGGSTGSGDDGFTVQPIDAGGSTIGTYELSIVSSDYGGTVAEIDSTDLSGDTDRTRLIAGVAFTLSDFTGSGGDLSTATGIRQVSGSNRPDTAEIGLAVIPEPATVALVGLGGVILLSRRRSRA